MRPPIRIFIATLSLVLLPVTLSITASRAADSQLKAALEQYTRRNYPAAIESFQTILKRDPRNVQAAFYLANAYYQTRQTSAAIQYYRWILTASPGSSEANSSRSILQRLGAASPAENGEQRHSSLVDTGSNEKPLRGSAGTSDLQVVVVRNLGDHPACTADFIRDVKAAVKKFPPQVVALAARHNCKIYVSPTMIDLHPELQNTKPSTYEMGHTFKNCPAMFESPNVVVCQYSQRGENSDAWEANTDALASLRHEFGHAIDAFMGYVTQRERFRHQYEMERSRVTDPEARTELKYYIQEGRDRELGASETFAEGCAILFGGAETSWRQIEQNYFKQAFPNVLSVIQSKLDKIQQGAAE